MDTAENTQCPIRDTLDDEEGASVFINRDLVEPETIIDEDRIVGRDEQLESVVSHLKPALQGNRLPNLLLYGPVGTGKLLIINAVTQQIIDFCKSKGEHGNTTPLSTASDRLSRAAVMLWHKTVVEQKTHAYPNDI